MSAHLLKARRVGARARTRRCGRRARSGAALCGALLLGAIALGGAPAPVGARALHPPARKPARTRANFDPGAQRVALESGLMSDQGRTFAGAKALSAAETTAALGKLAQLLQSRGVTGAVAAVATHGPVSMVAFDSLLADTLGLGGVAWHVEQSAREAGLRPPWYFGSEAVVRLLGLRYEQPIGFEALDLYPTEALTRAEAAYSLAKALALGEGELGWARELLGAFALPKLSAAQLEPLRIAVSLIGYPYVWGGTTDGTEDGLAHGGFDCSGFVWRVYKLSGLPFGEAIKGRTAAAQAGEIGKAARLRAGRLRPGDLLFFGSAGFRGAVTEKSIVHEGIYLGDNWVIHSSEEGVYILPLKGSWLGSTFAFGRRVLPG
jgi:cell wall-associated NlpC family hydrolase